MHRRMDDVRLRRRQAKRVASRSGAGTRNRNRDGDGDGDGGSEGSVVRKVGRRVESGDVGDRLGRIEDVGKGRPGHCEAPRVAGCEWRRAGQGGPRVGGHDSKARQWLTGGRGTS